MDRIIQKFVTTHLLDHLEGLYHEGKVEELWDLDEFYMQKFYDGYEDEKSSLLDLSEYIDVLVNDINIKNHKQHSESYPPDFFKQQILDDLNNKR